MDPGRGPNCVCLKIDKYQELSSQTPPPKLPALMWAEFCFLVAKSFHMENTTGGTPKPCEM